MESKELTVRIESEGGILTLTPQGLLGYYLADAREVQGRPGVYEGMHPTDPSKRLYVQKEVLAGLLMDAREKHLNPITDIYLIPSNSPNKKASHKIKYTAGLQQLRKLPGYLAIHSGLIVRREKEIVETHGSFYLDSDILLGAWCEVDFVGHHRPIRHDITLKEARRSSSHWNDRPGTMLVKTVEDQCVYLKVLPIFGQDINTPAGEDGEILLEATEPGTFATAPSQEKPPLREGYDFLPDTPYVGEVSRLLPVEIREQNGQKRRIPGIVSLTTEHGVLSAFFYERPPCLKERQEGDWWKIIGMAGQLSFEAKTDKAGTGTFWYVKEFSIVKPDAMADPQDEPGDAIEDAEVAA